MFEFFDNHIIVFRTEQMLKLSKHILIFSWVKLCIIFVFKFLKLEEEVLEFFGGWNIININSKNRLTCLKTFSLLAHSTIMNWISLILILNCEHFPVFLHDVFGVLLEEVEYSNIKLLVPLYWISIMEYLTWQMAVFNIHVFESVLVLVLNQLIVQCLFQINSFDVKKNYHTVVVTSVAETVISIPSFLISVYFLVNNISWSPHFGKKIESNVLETEVACNVKWSSVEFISLYQQLQYIIFTLHCSILISRVISVSLWIEFSNNFRQLSKMDVFKDTVTRFEFIFSKFNRFIYLMLLTFTTFFFLLHFSNFLL